jgi:hypothetical protein
MIRFIDVLELLVGRRGRERQYLNRSPSLAVGADDADQDNYQPVSFFLHPTKKQRIKNLAIELGRRPHDLLLEGVDLVLRKYEGATTPGIADPAQNDLDPDVADRYRRLQKIAGPLGRLVAAGEPLDQNRELGSAIKPRPPGKPSDMFVPELFERENPKS